MKGGMAFNGIRDIEKVVPLHWPVRRIAEHFGIPVFTAGYYLRYLKRGKKAGPGRPKSGLDGYRFGPMYREKKEKEIHKKIKTMIALYQSGETPAKIIDRFDFFPFSPSFIYSKIRPYLTKEAREKHRENLFAMRRKIKRAELLNKIADCTSDEMAGKKLGVCGQYINILRKKLKIPSLSKMAREKRKKEEAVIVEKAMGFYREGIVIRKIADLMGKKERWLDRRINELTTKNDREMHKKNQLRILFEKRRKELTNKLRGCRNDAEAAKRLGILQFSVYRLRKKYDIPAFTRPGRRRIPH